MAKVIHFTSAVNAGVVVNANLTRYIQMANIYLVARTTESDAHITYRAAGVVSNLYIRVSANTVSADSTLRVRINSGNGSGVVTITASTTGEFEDTSNTDNIAAADEVNYSLVTGATGTSMTIRGITSVFAATTNTVIRYAVSDVSVSVNAVTAYSVLGGRGPTNNGTESTGKVNMKTAGTLKNLFANVTATGASNNTLRIRKNGANGNQVITVTASTTGIYEDTSNTDTVSVDDDCNYSTTTGASGATLTITGLGVEFETTDSSTQYIMGRDSGGTTFTAATSLYAIIGGTNENNATETNARFEANFDATFSKLQVNVTTHVTSTDSTMRFRIDGGSGNQLVTMTANTTGLYEDSSNSDAVTAAQEINYLGLAGTGTGFISSFVTVVSTVSGATTTSTTTTTTTTTTSSSTSSTTTTTTSSSTTTTSSSTTSTTSTSTSVTTTSSSTTTTTTTTTSSSTTTTSSSTTTTTTTSTSTTTTSSSTTSTTTTTTSTTTTSSSTTTTTSTSSSTTTTSSSTTTTTTTSTSVTTTSSSTTTTITTTSSSTTTTTTTTTSTTITTTSSSTTTTTSTSTSISTTLTNPTFEFGLTRTKRVDFIGQTKGRSIF